MKRMLGGMLPEALQNQLTLEANAPYLSVGLAGVSPDASEDEQEWEAHWIDIGGEG